MLTFGIVLAVVILILGVRYIDHLDKRSKEAARDLEGKLSGEKSQGNFKLKKVTKTGGKEYIRIK